MKKINIILIIFFILIEISFSQIGGFVNDTKTIKSKITTVKQALKLKDDSLVLLKGHIINDLGNEKYTFSDNTGEIIIEIDNKDWNGRTITSKDTIEIYGEVDKEILKPTKIDVISFNII